MSLAPGWPASGRHLLSGRSRGSSPEAATAGGLAGENQTRAALSPLLSFVIHLGTLDWILLSGRRVWGGGGG